MANQKQIKKRVKSIKNIGKITSALEMVSASKVQKAQEKALSAKPYAGKVYELIQSMAGEKEINIPLLRQPEVVKTELYIIISTNKGLAGSLNTSLFSLLSREIADKKTVKKFITLGLKGRNFALENGELIADFSEKVPFDENLPGLIEIIIDSFSREYVDAVYLSYNDFVTVLKQEPVIKRLFPIIREESSVKSAYTYEPSAKEVLEKLLIFYIENQIRDAIFEAEASEHSARMIAMKNASDSASDLTETLSLEYNKARQANITTEIADVVTSTESLNYE